jgi:hypothetical protein
MDFRLFAGTMKLEKILLDDGANMIDKSSTVETKTKTKNSNFRTGTVLRQDSCEQAKVTQN